MNTISTSVMSPREVSSLLKVARDLQVVDNHLSHIQLRLDDYLTTSDGVVRAMDHLYDALAHITEAWEAIIDATGVDQGDVNEMLWGDVA